MGCPSTLHQLMLDCWQKERSERPRFSQIVGILDKLIRNPDNLKCTGTMNRFTQTHLDRGLLDLSSCLTVEDWLDSIRLGHYRDNFAMAGYSSLGMVMRMNIEDVRSLGITMMGHQKKILSSIQAMRSQLLNTNGPRRHL